MRENPDAPDRGRVTAKGRVIEVDESALALVEAAVSDPERAPVEPEKPKGKGRKRGKGGG